MSSSSSKQFSDTFYIGKLSGTCVLLRSDCERGDCSSTLCISGPADCGAVKEPCPQLLPANAGAGQITWDCGESFNPYNSPIADGETCTARWVTRIHD
jgi:hypothetical protein